MLKSKVIKKGAEPSIVISAIAVGVESVNKQLELNLETEHVAVISGFLYGVYRAIRNFFKNRKK